MDSDRAFTDSDTIIIVRQRKNSDFMSTNMAFRLKWTCAFLLLLVVLRWEPTTAAPIEIREMNFLEAIREISKNYNVYFSFDREIVKDLTVFYETDPEQSL